MVSSYKSVTDSRMVIDVVAPGYGPEDITVKAAKTSDGNGKKVFSLKVEGKYVRPTGAHDKLVPRFAYDKVVGDGFKEVITDDRFNDGDYDTANIKYAVKNGVIRISIPKTADAIGTKLTATTDNINAVATSDDDTDDAVANN
jgi:HSP20 family molecular chaperone IbpA